MLDYGYAGFDVRHRLSASAIWSLPWGGNNPWAGGWQVNATVHRAQRLSVLGVRLHERRQFFCMRALDPTGIDRHVGDPVATGSPNEFDLLDSLGSAVRRQLRASGAGTSTSARIRTR